MESNSAHVGQTYECRILVKETSRE